MKRIYVLLFAAALGATALSCKEKTPAEKAKDKMEDAGENVKDAAEDVGDAAKEGAHDVKKKVE